MGLPPPPLNTISVYIYNGYFQLENESLKMQVEQLKQQLVDAEIMNGRKQIVTPSTATTPLPASIKQVEIINDQQTVKLKGNFRLRFPYLSEISNYQLHKGPGTLMIGGW